MCLLKWKLAEEKTGLKLINTKTTAMKKTILSLFAFMLTAGSFAQNENKFEKIDRLLNYFYENNKFMGSVTIREKEKVVFEKAYGFADVENKIRATPDTKYKIGSITKMFTSSILFQLVEEKKITLDTKLSAFYPEIKNADSISIHQLLTHQSGIYNYTDDPGFTEALKSTQTKSAMLKRIAGYEPAFKPGSTAQYSNSNYVLLGYIIEDITKKSYKANINDRITKPHGLKDTYYYSKVNSKRKEAYSYTFENGSWQKVDEWDSSVAFAAGALTSTPNDLTKFIKALFDGKVIKKETLAQMITLEQGYGSGILIFPFGERRFYGHNGGIEAFTSTLGYYPKDDLSISMIQNGNNYDSNEVMIGILSCYYKLPYTFPNLNTFDVPAEVLKSYEGLYTTTELPFKVKIVATGNTLKAIATGGQGEFELTPVSNNEFVFNPASLSMTFTASGFILEQGGTRTEFRKE